VALLASLGIDRRKVAVERNREIVPKSAFEGVVLAPGDQLEIVQFVGGG
jgi:thiamine biosynthesis protein ThiS